MFVLKNRTCNGQVTFRSFLTRLQNQERIVLVDAPTPPTPTPNLSCQNLITGRNEVVAKVMFLLVSVILSTGGGLWQGEPPWQGDPPGKENPSQQGEPPWQGDTPLQEEPPV